MNVRWYANIGSDAVPTWSEIDETDMFHFTGAGSVPSLAQPVIKPDAGYVWNEEVWIGPEVMSAGVKVANWVKPSAALQTGKVFKIVFSDALLSAPFISAYDTPDYDTWEKAMLAGSEETNYTGFIKLVATGSESVNTPPAVGWTKETTGHAGSGNPNALAGASSFVTIPFIPAAGGDFTFTVAVALPSDAEHGKEGKYDPIIAVVFVHV